MWFLVECGGFLDIVRILVKVYNLIKILIPIGLILFGALDLGKAVIASKEDEMKAAQKLLIKRAIYAVAVFLIFSLVQGVMSIAGNQDWRSCWKAANGSSEEKCKSGMHYDYDLMTCVDDE